MQPGSVWNGVSSRLHVVTHLRIPIVSLPDINYRTDHIMYIVISAMLIIPKTPMDTFIFHWSRFLLINDQQVEVLVEVQQQSRQIYALRK